MLSRVLPSSSLPDGYVVETKLTLPARWVPVLTKGDAGVLSSAERVIITTIESLFGFCVDVDEHTAFSDSHDAIAEGAAPCECKVFTFVDHESLTTTHP